MVLSTAALLHAQWVEIHPFANGNGSGNGRTARLLANYVLMRYGIPPFVRLRPRPAGDAYADASRRAPCYGEYGPTIALFYEMFDGWAASESSE